MDREKINTINALYKKQKAEGLTEEEKALQQALRCEYIQEFRQSLRAQLDNTYIQHEDGTLEKIPKKQQGVKND
ncbi:MAG: DUF896 domain-containing protein [Eubacteriales bacterium]|nr:DUF896 domain-containing protein [Eubacteriales bacterium]